MLRLEESVKLDGYIGILVYPASTDENTRLKACALYDRWLDTRREIGGWTKNNLDAYLKDYLRPDERPITRHTHNVVVNNGRIQLMKLIDGNSTAYFQYIGIGKGTTGATTADTDLQTAVGSRKQVSDRFESGNSGKWRVLFGSAENNDAAITEAVLADSASAGNILNRQTFTAVDHSAAANNTLTVIVTLSQS